MIEYALLEYLGIYPETIEKVDAVVERACEEHGIDSDEEVWPYVLERFEQAFGECAKNGQFTNELVAMAFSSLHSALCASGVDESRLDWDVNGYASCFIIDGEEVPA